MDDKKKFEYSYSAPTEEERREIDSIRKQYQPQEKKGGDIKSLRLLDREVKRPVYILGIVLDVIGALLLGAGMCLSMKVIGGGDYFILGIIVGISGIAVCIIDYFLCKALMKYRKKKYGEKILSLSEELLNERGD